MADRNTLDIIDSLFKGSSAETKDAESKGSDPSGQTQGSDTSFHGLYGLVGAPSCGKTTFAVQLADTLAASGRKVTYFSLLEDAADLVSKSLSRLTLKMDRLGEKGAFEGAADSMSIRRGDLTPAVLGAIDEYREVVGDRVRIVDYVPDMASLDDCLCCNSAAIVDSLQAFPLIDDERKSIPLRLTAFDVLRRLKDISKEKNVMIIVIYSYSVTDKLTQCSLMRMKDTDGIISCCDVIWDLRLKNVSSPWEDIRKSPREMELACLKNKYAQAGYMISYDYYPANNLFIRTGDCA